MKKVIFIMAITASLVISSCKGNTKQSDEEVSKVAEEPTQTDSASVVGVWKMTNIEVDMEIPKGQEKAFEDMKKKMIEATVYSFNEDGTMSFKNNLVKETKGTYTYTDGKITIKNNTSKQDETLTVDELTTTKLVISSEQGGRKATMSFAK